jgi:hypothetical protein
MPQAHRAVAFAGVHAEGPQAQQRCLDRRRRAAGSIEARQLGFALPVPAHESHAGQGA